MSQGIVPAVSMADDIRSDLLPGWMDSLKGWIREMGNGSSTPKAGSGGKSARARKSQANASLVSASNAEIADYNYLQIEPSAKSANAVLADHGSRVSHWLSDLKFKPRYVWWIYRSANGYCELSNNT